MRTSSWWCATLLAAGAAASCPGGYSSRPVISPSPHTPRLAVPSPPARSKFCTVKTHGNGSDDSAYILSAFHSCNNGGHVLFSANTTYTVGTAMDWTFLQSIDIGEFLCLVLCCVVPNPTPSPGPPRVSRAGSWCPAVRWGHGIVRAA